MAGSVKTFSWARSAAHVAAPFDAAFHAQFNAMLVGLPPASHAAFLGDVRAAAAADYRIYGVADPFRAVGAHFADPETPEVEEPTWVLRDELGDIIKDRRNLDYSLMDPRVAGWRSHLAGTYWDAQLGATQLDGILLENASKGVPWFCRGPDDEYPVGYGEEAWKAAIESTINALQVVGPPGPPHNMLFEGPQRLPGDPESTRTYLTNTGGAYHDTWRGPEVMTVDASLFNRAWYWLDTILVAMEAAKAFNHQFFLRVRVTDDTSAQARLFALAAFLLKAWDGAYFALSDDEDPKWFPEYGVRLGEPLGEMAVNDDGTYSRDFEFGRVVLNPLEQTMSVEAPTTTDGQTYERASDGSDVGTIDLGSLSGEILSLGGSVVTQFPVPVNYEDKAVSYPGSRRTVVTMVLPLAKGDLASNSEQLSARNALWFSDHTTAVQWIGQGEPYRNSDGSFHSWRHVRCYVDSTSNPGEKKQITIEKRPNEDPPLTYVIPQSVQTFLETGVVRVWMGGVATQFDLGGMAQLEQHRVEPVQIGANDTVRFYEWTVRLTNEPQLFAWLCLELARNQKEVRFWLHIGNSRVRDYLVHGNVQSPDLTIGDATNKTLSVTISSGGGVLAYIRNDQFTTMRKVVQPGVTAWELLDWSTDFGNGELTHNRMPAGSGLGYQGAILTGTPDTSTIAMAEEEIHAKADNWDQVGLDPYGKLPPRPWNASANREMTKAEARASLDAWVASLVSSKMVQRRPYGSTGFTAIPAVTNGGNQDAAFGTSRGWAFLCCGSPAMDRFLQWCTYKQLHRSQNFVNEDGSLFRAQDHGLCAFFNSFPNPTGNTDRLGYSGRPSSAPASDQGGQAWVGQDKEHWEHHWESVYALTSGDRLALRWAQMQTQNWLASHHTGLPGEDGRAPGVRGEHWGTGSQTVYSYISARGMGRSCGTGAELLMLTGDPDLRVRLRRWMQLKYDGHFEPISSTLYQRWSGGDHQGEHVAWQIIPPFVKHPWLEVPFTKPWMESTVATAALALSRVYAETDPGDAAKFERLAWRIAKSITLFGFLGEFGKTMGFIRASTSGAFTPPPVGTIIRERSTGYTGRVVGVRFNIRHILVVDQSKPMLGGFLAWFDDATTGAPLFQTAGASIQTPIVPELMAHNVDGTGKGTGVPLTREDLFVLDPDPTSPAVDFRNWHYDGTVGAAWSGQAVAVALVLAQKYHDVQVARRARELIDAKFARSTGFGSLNPNEDFLAAGGDVLFAPLQDKGRMFGANTGEGVWWGAAHYMYINLCSTAQPWQERRESTGAFLGGVPVGMDVWPNNGYPTSLRADTYLESWLGSQLHNPDKGYNWPPIGTVFRIRATSNGSGRLVVRHSGANSAPDVITYNNVTTLNATFTTTDYGGIYVEMHDAVITGIQVFENRFTALVDAGKILNPDWMERAKRVELFRDLNLSEVNGWEGWPWWPVPPAFDMRWTLGVESWSDRRPRNSYTYSSEVRNTDEWRYSTTGSWSPSNSAIGRTVTGRTRHRFNTSGAWSSASAYLSVLTGQSSGATATLMEGTSGSPGSILVQKISGTFSNGEVVRDAQGRTITLQNPHGEVAETRTGILGSGATGAPGSVQVKRNQDWLGNLLYFHPGETITDSSGNSIQIANPNNAKWDAVFMMVEPGVPQDVLVDMAVELYQYGGNLRQWWLCLPVRIKFAGEQRDVGGGTIAVGDGFPENLGAYIRQKVEPLAQTGPVLSIGLELQNELWNDAVGAGGAYLEKVLSFKAPYSSWPFGDRRLNTQGLRSNDLMDRFRLQVSGVEHLIKRILGLQRAAGSDQAFDGRGDWEGPSRPFTQTWLHHDALTCAPYFDPIDAVHVGDSIDETLDAIEWNMEDWIGPTDPDPNRWNKAYESWVAKLAPRGHGKWELCFYEGYCHHMNDGNPGKWAIVQGTNLHPRMGDITKRAFDHFHGNAAPGNERVYGVAVFLFEWPNAYGQAWGLYDHPYDTRAASPRAEAFQAHLDSHHDTTGISITALSAVGLLVTMPAGNLPFVFIRALSAISLTVTMPQGSLSIEQNITALAPVSIFVAMQRGSLTLGSSHIYILAAGPIGLTVAMGQGSVQSGATISALSAISLTVAMPQGSVSVPVTMTALQPLALDVDMPQGSILFTDSTTINALAPISIFAAMQRGSLSLPVTIGALTPVAMVATMARGSIDYGYTITGEVIALRLQMLPGQVSLDVVIEALGAVALVVDMPQGSLLVTDSETINALAPISLYVAMQQGSLDRPITALTPIGLSVAMPQGSLSHGYTVTAQFPIMMMMSMPDGGFGADVTINAADAARMFVAGLSGGFEEGFDGPLLTELAKDLARLAQLGEVSEEIVYHLAGQRPGLRMLVIVERFEREPSEPGGRMIRGALLHIPLPYLDRVVRTTDEVTLDLLKGGTEQTVGIAAIKEKTPLEWVLEVRE